VAGASIRSRSVTDAVRTIPSPARMIIRSARGLMKTGHSRRRSPPPRPCEWRENRSAEIGEGCKEESADREAESDPRR
jgi:hypothetical protein